MKSMTTPTSNRRWRVARWALLVAGAVGLAAPASAQIGRLLHGRPGPAPLAVAGKSASLTEAQSAMAQIKVESAWLTDPATFPWPLTARISGTVLHVSGEVPSQAVRQQALKIAGEHTGLAVIDAIKINNTLARPVGAGGDEPLEKMAADHVRKYFGEQGGAVQVSARTNGQVTVTGSISSHEEKLAVGQSLRAVKGCTCVVNQLQVGTTQHDGKSHALVSADGRLVVPDAGVKQAAFTSQEPGGITPVGHQEGTSVRERWAPYNPLRVFGRGSTPAKSETPSPVAPSNLPPSMQSGSYRDLAGKTPTASPKPVVTPTGGTAPVEPGKVEQRIRKLCGAAAMDVQVTPEGPKNLKVQVKIKKAGDAEPLATKILAMPELVPYEVSLSMTADRP
jgi:osmotically-inducible protein OsmY